MTDKELYLKYNMTPTDRRKKDDSLERDLYERNLSWPEPFTRGKVLLLLHGSYNCNLQCIYCENQHLRNAYHGAIMSEDMVREIVRKFKGNLREVTWHGGESLLLPKSLLRALEEEKKAYNLDFVTTLQTNSLLLDNEMLAFLDEYNINFGTSFDGIYNTTSRGIRSTESILRCIREYPGRIGFISVTYKDTIDYLIENYEYFKSLGVSGIQSCIVRENIIENDNPYLVKNEVAIPKMLEYIDYWIHDVNHPVRDGYIVRFIQRLLGVTHLCEDSYCLGGWLIIDPHGNIGFCGHNMLEDSIINIDSVSEFSDILTHPKYLSSMYKQRSLIKKCEPCEWYHVCHGACMGLNYEYDHTYQSISPRNCEYTQGVLSGIYELIKDIDISRKDIYNPLFLEILEKCNYYSLTEIKEIERKYN